MASHIDDLQTAADNAELAVEESRDELEALHRDATYQIPAGKLKLVHVPLYTEVLWASKAKRASDEPVTA